MAIVLNVSRAIPVTDARPAAPGVSISLHAGDIGTIVGPPHSGKGALLRSLIGDEKLRQGEIEILGVSISRARNSEIGRLRQRLGMLPQEDIFLMRHTVFDNIALPLRIAGVSESQVHQRVTMQLAEQGLLPKSRFRIDTLGREDRRRVSLAQIAVKYPALVLADLRSDPFEIEVVRPALLRLASLGASVLLFECRETPDGYLKFERKITRRESLLVA